MRGGVKRSGGEEKRVEKIINRRENRDGLIEYLIKWMGDDETTWEPESIVRRYKLDDLVKEYDEDYRKGRGAGAGAGAPPTRAADNEGMKILDVRTFKRSIVNDASAADPGPARAQPPLLGLKEYLVRRPLDANREYYATWERPEGRAQKNEFIMMEKKFDKESAANMAATAAAEAAAAAKRTPEEVHKFNAAAKKAKEEEMGSLAEQIHELTEKMATENERLIQRQLFSVDAPQTRQRREAQRRADIAQLNRLNGLLRDQRVKRATELTQKEMKTQNELVELERLKELLSGAPVPRPFEEEEYERKMTVFDTESEQKTADDMRRREKEEFAHAARQRRQQQQEAVVALQQQQQRQQPQRGTAAVAVAVGKRSRIPEVIDLDYMERMDEIRRRNREEENAKAAKKAALERARKYPGMTEEQIQIAEASEATAKAAAERHREMRRLEKAREDQAKKKAIRDAVRAAVDESRKHQAMQTAGVPLVPVFYPPPPQGRFVPIAAAWPSSSSQQQPLSQQSWHVVANQKIAAAAAAAQQRSSSSAFVPFPHQQQQIHLAPASPRAAVVAAPAVAQPRARARAPTSRTVIELNDEGEEVITPTIDLTADDDDDDGGVAESKAWR